VSFPHSHTDPHTTRTTVFTRVPRALRSLASETRTAVRQVRFTSYDTDERMKKSIVEKRLDAGDKHAAGTTISANSPLGSFLIKPTGSAKAADRSNKARHEDEGDADAAMGVSDDEREHTTRTRSTRHSRGSAAAAPAAVPEREPAVESSAGRRRRGKPAEVAVDSSDEDGGSEEPAKTPAHKKARGRGSASSGSKDNEEKDDEEEYLEKTPSSGRKRAVSTPSSNRSKARTVEDVNWKVTPEYKAKLSQFVGNRQDDSPMHPTNMYVASGAADNTVKLWDTISGETMAVLEHLAPVKCVCFSPQNSRLITGHALEAPVNGKVQRVLVYNVWDVVAQAKHFTIQELLEEAPEPASSAAGIFQAQEEVDCVVAIDSKESRFVTGSLHVYDLLEPSADPLLGSKMLSLQYEAGGASASTAGAAKAAKKSPFRVKQVCYSSDDSRIIASVRNLGSSRPATAQPQAATTSKASSASASSTSSTGESASNIFFNIINNSSQSNKEAVATATAAAAPVPAKTSPSSVYDIIVFDAETGHQLIVLSDHQASVLFLVSCPFIYNSYTFASAGMAYLSTSLEWDLLSVLMYRQTFTRLSCGTIKPISSFSP
jgi:hypothetical protein